MEKPTTERLKRNSEKIMNSWEERANNEVLAAWKLESLALRNSLPELLLQIADALSTKIDRTAARANTDRADSLRVGKKHGRERAGSFIYTMDQMIFEYHILRQVIYDVMEEEKPLSDVEREVIVCSIEQAVNDAATQFSETLKTVQERVAASLTHDLRGPITAAKIHAQTLMRRPADAEYCVKAAGRIASGMDRLNSMIQDLLDASLVRAGRDLPIQIQECDLDHMVREITEEFNLIYGDRFMIEATPPALGFWSSNEIRRVVENLATNAVKYGTPETPITISIQQTESKVTLAIHNEGKAITADEQEVLFQQFHRTQSAKNQAGWGLGLTVVKGITEAHHGKVHLESIEGKGTTFTIELPRDARR